MASVVEFPAHPQTVLTVLKIEWLDQCQVRVIDIRDFQFFQNLDCLT
jgi:hypothetical protein